jgi:exosortase C (VPDSG-CTERM-specific)
MITPKLSPEKVEPHPSSDDAMSAPVCEPMVDLRRRRSVIGFSMFGILLLAVFSKSLFSLMVYAAGQELHSHILLIPFVSAYLIYIRRSSLPTDYAFSPGWAMIPLVAGVIALAAARIPGVSGQPMSQNDYFTLMALSFVSFLAAGGFFFLGRKWMAAVAFPFAFLLFMVPLPDRAIDFLETASKLASAEAANMFFNLTGTPTLRNGIFFELPNITLQVAQECSGIRSSWVLLITSLLAANLFLRTPWRRTALVAAVIPLGVLRNGFRILVIGLLCVNFGPEMINSVIHRRGGPLFFVLSLIPLFLLLWGLRRAEVRRATSPNQ